MVGQNPKRIQMTIIAAKRDGKTASIGGDSGAFDDDTVFIATTPKVWRVGSTLLGGCGNFRIIEVAKRSNLADPNALRDYLAEQPHLPDAWNLLVVTVKSISEIGSDFSVVTFRETYCAIGSGDRIALGALATSVSVPRIAVQQALKATERHSTTCRPPFTIINLDNSLEMK